MDIMIGACGIICTNCPAFIAYKNDDQELRVKTAEEWSKAFSPDIKPEHINCTGCQTDEAPQISHCAECHLRTCSRGREIANCAYCAEYPCEALEQFFVHVPEARKTLDEIHVR